MAALSLEPFRLAHYSEALLVLAAAGLLLFKLLSRMAGAGVFGHGGWSQNRGDEAAPGSNPCVTVQPDPCAKGDGDGNHYLSSDGKGGTLPTSCLETRSPVCTLAHASGATSCTTSLVDTGQSAAPGGAVDSILAVKALRRSRFSYRTVTRGVPATRSHGPLVPSLSPRHTQLHIKIPGLDPQDLSPKFLSDVDEALRLRDIGLQLVGASVRRGCIELTLDFLDFETGLHNRAGSSEGHAARFPAAARPFPVDLELPALVLSALGFPQLHQRSPNDALDAAAIAAAPPATAMPADGCSVLVQRGGACWTLQWDGEAMQWVVRDVVDADPGAGAGFAAGPPLVLEAPLAVHVAQPPLDSKSAGPRLLRLCLRLRSECDALRADMFIFSAADGSAAAGSDLTGDNQRGPELSLVAKASGRTAVARVLAATSRAAGTARAGSSMDLDLEFDLGYLEKGRPRGSRSLVVRLELWRGQRMLISTSLACLHDADVVSEMRELQYDVAAAGDLDPEDEGYLSGEQQRAETQELLGDLAAWLDFVACTDDLGHAHSDDGNVRNGAEGTTAAESQEDLLDLSGQVAGLLALPQAGPVLLDAGRHLLEYFVCHGLVGLARSVHADWQPRARAMGAAADGNGSGDTEAGAALTHLHRAVRSGSQAMVELVLQWVHDEGERSGEGGGPAAVAAAWASRGPYGVTPLHLMAADARCGATSCVAAAAGGPPVGSAAATVVSDIVAGATVPSDGGDGTGYGLGVGVEEAPAGTPAEMAEALLRWVVASHPAAVTVWNTARDSSGNTPAMLWAALGGQDIQPQAAAAALTNAVVNSCCEHFASPSEEGKAGSMAPPPSAPAAAGPDTMALAPAANAASPGAGSSSYGSPSPATGAADCADAEAQVLAAAAAAATRPGGHMRLLLRLVIRGFPSAALERRYVDYVTAATLAPSFIWIALMVVAHVMVVFKAQLPGEGRQALVGGFAYFVSLACMLARPRVYVAWREELMLSCVLGRTLCRLLMWLLPRLLHMSGSVQKYILFGLDVLLDGFMEGTFEPVRVRRVFWARLLEWPVMALLIRSRDLRPTFLSALLRSSAVSAAGLTLSLAMDLRMRATFLRNLGRRTAAREGKAKAD